MKVVFNLIIFFFGISNMCLSQGRGDQIFDESFIHEVRINSELDINEMTDLFYIGWSSGNYTYALSTVTIDGNILDSVGVRIKGGSSAFDVKKPLKLDFNSFVIGQRYDGIKKLNLHQGDMDSSFIREAVTYSLFRNAGVKTVRTSFAKVYLNGNYEGVYTLIEQIDNNFIKNRFASSAGALYKTGKVGLDLKYELDNSLPYDEFEFAINQIPTDLLDEQLPEYLDVESFLRFFALQIFVNGVDGPLTADYNYYIYYQPKAGTYIYIPWDYNLSLYKYANYTLFENSKNFLFNRAVSNVILRQRYLDIFCDLLDYNFDEDRIQNLITTYQELLKDEVPNDPYIDKIGNFDSGVQDVRNVITNRISALTQEVNANISACNLLSNPIASMNVVINEIVASNDQDSDIKDPNGDTADWIELFNNTSVEVSLDGFYLSNDEDVLKHWRFPEDATIPANDYLIIWADRDVNEEGLHTDFKLSKTQGELYLSFENGEIIDEVIFIDQETNVGYARVPNGTGQFDKQLATFNASNNPTTTNVDDQNIALDWSIYPNPTQGSKTINVQFSEGTYSEIQIIDLYGRVMWKNELSTQGNNNIIVPINRLSNGVYSVLLFDKKTKEKRSQKLIVME